MLGSTTARAVVLGLLAARAALATEAVPLAWQTVEVGSRSGRVVAVAVSPDGERLALGDDAGLRAGPPGGRFVQLLSRVPVTDAVFLADGAVLAATARGLSRVAGVADRRWIAPGPGAGARAVHRVDAVAGAVAAATDAGVFVSRDGLRWQRLAGALPRAAATAVRLRRSGDGFTCFAVVDGGLWRVALRPNGSGFVAAAPQRETIPFAIRGDGAVDVAVDLPGAALAVVFPRSLALRRRDGPGEPWDVQSPELPPGARATRLGHSAGVYWLASDRGLLVAATLGGPWRRAAPPLGASEITAAAGGAGLLVAASRDAVRLGRAAGRASAAALADLPGGHEAEPSIERVHRAALHHLGLGPARSDALRRGVDRRGWLPIVVARVSAGWDRDTGLDRDQAFLSGATRHLEDRDWGRSDDYEVSLSLSWDLGDTAYHPEAIDVSRETREVIELRDDVLDEITQLYYERRRVIGELAAPVERTDGERLRLRLRADELAAGIDAWTGGWFATQVGFLAR